MEQKPKKSIPYRERILQFLVLQFAIFMFSTSGVTIKIAGTYPIFSFGFFFFYFVTLFITFLYALVWQQILKRIPLNTAYGNRSVGVIWSIVWGYLLFHEAITLNMVIGSVVIIIGVMLMVTADE